MRGKLRLGVLDLGNHLLATEVAPAVEAQGFERYWLSEHHEIESSFDGVNPVLMSALVAGVTSKIRVGPAGVLLAIHPPVRVAEDFRLLQTFFAGRMDLGIARSVPGDKVLPHFLDGRTRNATTVEFRARLTDLLAFLHDRDTGGRLPQLKLPCPADVEPAQTWVLGTSGRGAELAAELGVAYCYSHFYARNLDDGPRAIDCYRKAFRASPELAEPTWSVHVGGVCEATEAEARHQKERMGFVDAGPTREGTPFFGSEEAWAAELRRLAERYDCVELIVSGLHHDDVDAQVASYGRVARAAGLSP